MLRWVIWLLVLANAGYFVWTQGYLTPLGLMPHEEREPQRLQGQIQPDTLRLLNAPRVETAPPMTSLATLPSADSPPRPAAQTAPKAAGSSPPQAAELATEAAPPKVQAAPPPPTAAPAPSPAPAPAPSVADARACWLASGFNEPQADALRAALTLLDLPRGTWQLNETRSGGRWIVYMGRYDNAVQLDRKKAELQELNVAYRDVSAPGLSPGLSLGTYSSEVAAQQALQNVARSGVRTARVAQERAESTSFSLRLPDATPAQRNAVAGVGAALAGKPLRPCN
ncbi:SPOR domain-containing protein [Hydrogenophaga sp.]|uniref:SPOR domain-containing protein n=1 Tax=Hydrogenophaga sp. TaxID=1904254 RepID=UPI003F6A693C